MFPTISFNTALGGCPVILVLPLHRKVSLRPVVRIRQKQGCSCIGLSLAFFNDLGYLGGEKHLE